MVKFLNLKIWDDFSVLLWIKCGFMRLVDHEIVFLFTFYSVSAFRGVWVKNEPRTKAWSALITLLWTEQIILITWQESSQMFILLSVVPGFVCGFTWLAV